jgi:hypothetical protein
MERLEARMPVLPKLRVGSRNALILAVFVLTGVPALIIFILDLIVGDLLAEQLPFWDELTAFIEFANQ